MVSRGYEGLLLLLGGKSRKILTATTEVIREHSGTIVYYYHATPVVRFSPEGNIHLQTGGYATSMTKAKMNEVLPFPLRVMQKNSQWYLTGATETPFPFEDELFLLKILAGYTPLLHAPSA